jgi:UDP-MurNAc hydroxylase
MLTHRRELSPGGIEFVNHATCRLTVGDIRLLTDPWLFGPAFNSGWDLLCETPQRYLEFDGATHIWLTHEHPDHFAPQVLRSIDAARRRAIIVLFHESKDGAVRSGRGFLNS